MLAWMQFSDMIETEIEACLNFNGFEIRLISCKFAIKVQ